MKILITTDLYKVSTNGVVTSVKNLLEELEGKGHDVRILTFSEDIGSYKEENVYYIKSLPIGFIYPDMRMPISYRNSLVRELIDWKPDIIHSQCEFFSFHYAQRISKLTGAPLVHTYHTLYEDYVTYLIPSKRIGKHVVAKVSRFRLRNTQKVIAPTDKVQKVLRGYGMKNDICIVPSGLDLSRFEFRMTKEERKLKRHTIGIMEDHQVLINLGRLGTEKNIDELISFFTEALKENEKLIFLIVGDGPAKAELEAKCVGLGVEKQVIFTGMVPPALVREYYQLADLFVSASTSETQGLTYIEAAASGLPLLCRKDECLNGVIEEGVNGYQYTSKEQFLSKLQMMLKDSQWRKNAAKRSEEIARGYDKRFFGNKVESIYHDVIIESK